MDSFHPDFQQKQLMQSAPGILGYKPGIDFKNWKNTVSLKLRELIGEISTDQPLNIRTEHEIHHETYQ